MNIHIAIGGAETLRLKGALLIYEGRGQGFVSWHEAHRPETGGAPYLEEAQELTTEFIKGLANGLGKPPPLEVFPENVLARTPELTVWWTARCTRRMYFRAGSAMPAEMNGMLFSQPTLVWKLAGRELSIRALAGSPRPSTETPLMLAPYWNVDGENGRVCQGSMRSPGDNGVEMIAGWERAFFRSEFTHPTGIRALTTHPGGHAGLWEQVAGGRRRFPEHFLVPAHETLREFIMREW